MHKNAIYRKYAMQLRGATVPRVVIFQVDRREEGRRWNKLVGLGG